MNLVLTDYKFPFFMSNALFWLDVPGVSAAGKGTGSHNQQIPAL